MIIDMNEAVAAHKGDEVKGGCKGVRIGVEWRGHETKE